MLGILCAVLLVLSFLFGAAVGRMRAPRMWLCRSARCRRAGWNRARRKRRKQARARHVVAV